MSTSSLPAVAGSSVTTTRCRSTRGSQFEIAYRFDDRSRLGVAISHYSNAGLGDTNPGTATLSLYFSIPFDRIGKMFD